MIFHQRSSDGVHRTAPTAAIAWATTAVALSALLVNGCRRSDSLSRSIVSGSVTFEGKPLKTGEIRFTPCGNTQGPSAGANIVDGRYVVEYKGGVVLGTQRVEIMAFRSATPESMPPEIMYEEGMGRVQFLPDRYNRQSELKVEVTAEGPNEFNFDLK